MLMQKITSVAALKSAIQLLEVEQASREVLLKEQFHLTYTGLRPVNLLRSALKDLTSSPGLIENLAGTALGLATGYLSKELVVGASVNRFRKLIGFIVQFGISNLISHNAENIKSFGQSIFQSFFHKKEPIKQEQNE